MHVLKCIRTVVCQHPCQDILLDATAWSGVHALYIVTAALVLLLYLWKCCCYISIEMPLCCAFKCTVLMMTEI